MGKTARRALASAAGIVLALGLAELGASALHGGAFPYVTTFVADATYGVRLAPDAVSRVRSRHGRITTVRTNGASFRGPEWSARATVPRALVIGDSQAMGLHVEWDDTATARLRSEHALDARNAAVPTWGPPEYLAIQRELLERATATREPISHVVLVLNVANDWHEAGVPNARRTTARRGWAVRPAAGAGAPIEHPLHGWVLGRSHLAYAARRAIGGATGIAPLRGDEPHRLIADLAWLRRAPAGHRSRLGPLVRDARDACRAHGCELLVVALPLDVQVHAREWSKYREAPIDMRATEELSRALIADADALGVRAIDALPALRDASPGAFLPDDPHLSPRGHAALARALAAPITSARMEARR